MMEHGKPGQREVANDMGRRRWARHWDRRSGSGCGWGSGGGHGCGSRHGCRGGHGHGGGHGQGGAGKVLRGELTCKDIRKVSVWNGNMKITQNRTSDNPSTGECNG